jgi:tetratricopeptide (TPR) repeat protein
MPVVNQGGWLSLIPHVVVIALLFVAYWLILDWRALYVAPLTYLALSFGLRFGIARAQRHGMKLLMQGKFREAIPHFEESYSFFSRHEWVDRWRYLILLTSSAISYREMALCNIAFAYGQAGDGLKCKEYYERALSEFPQSALARTSLNMIKAAGAVERKAEGIG